MDPVFKFVWDMVLGDFSQEICIHLSREAFQFLRLCSSKLEGDFL